MKKSLRYSTEGLHSKACALLVQSKRSRPANKMVPCSTPGMAVVKPSIPASYLDWDIKALDWLVNGVVVGY